MNRRKREAMGDGGMPVQRSRGRVAVFAAAVALFSCQRYPESYPPPEQRQPAAVAAGREIDVVHFGDTDSERFIVSGVYGPEAQGWRWSARRPTLRFRLTQTANRTLVADFFIAPQTFEVTGPVTVRFLVNGNLLDSVRYDSHGPQRFAKRIPEDWLAAGEDAVVTLEIDKAYSRPPDMRELGVILQRIGFVTE